MSKQAVNYLLGALEQSGYLRRADDPDDKRSRRIELTERGEAVRQTIRATVADIESELATELGDRAFEQLRARCSCASTTRRSSAARLGSADVPRSAHRTARRSSRARRRSPPGCGSTRRPEWVGGSSPTAGGRSRSSADRRTAGRRTRGGSASRRHPSGSRARGRCRPPSRSRSSRTIIRPIAAAWLSSNVSRSTCSRSRGTPAPVRPTASWVRARASRRRPRGSCCRVRRTRRTVSHRARRRVGTPCRGGA